MVKFLAIWTTMNAVIYAGVAYVLADLAWLFRIEGTDFDSRLEILGSVVLTLIVTACLTMVVNDIRDFG